MTNQTGRRIKFWHTIFAFLGVALVAATPLQSDKQVEEVRNALVETFQRLPIISESLSMLAEIFNLSPLERSCAKGEDDRQSDLCAQWKAADAAAKAAWWAAFGSIVATIGTIGLYWQLILTRKAVLETGNATVAMQEANKIARDEQRPWLQMEIKATGVSDHGQQTMAAFDVTLKNIGATPAHRIAVRSIRIKNSGGGPEQPNAFFDEAISENYAGYTSQSLMPGDSHTFREMTQDEWRRQSLTEQLEPNSVHLVNAVYEYSGGKRAQTSQSFILSEDSPTGGIVHVRRTGEQMIRNVKAIRSFYSKVT
jgi:hypothetical protein